MATAGGAAEGVAVGRAVELDGLADDAGAGGRGGVDQQVGVGQRAARAVRPSRPASCSSGRMAIRLPPAFTQSLSMRDLRRGERHLAQDDDVVGRPGSRR